jgi:hypothetical protein
MVSSQIIESQADLRMQALVKGACIESLGMCVRSMRCVCPNVANKVKNY